MIKKMAFCWLLLWCAAAAQCETGMIVPTDAGAEDAKALSIESMDVDIAIDNGHALVSMKEVFRSQSRHVLEGTYSLALPDNAAVSDFAVWDGLTRIPGVILERKRANELYQQIRNESIDPGLLQSGEVSENEAPGQAAHSTEFSVKIVPIPAYGYKRVEAMYRQNVKLAQLSGMLVFPLKAATPVQVARLNVRVQIRSAFPIANAVAQGYGLTLQRTGDVMAGTFTRQNVLLNEDLTLKYSLANDATPRVVAYRDGAAEAPGYFEASALLQAPQADTPATAPRTIIALFDTSLSMQWDKLERSFRALEETLRGLAPKDSFNVLVFNSEASAFAPSPQPATTDAIGKSLDFVRASKLRGGTNVGAALHAAFKQCVPNTYVVLLSDGEMTEGVLAPSKAAADADRQWRAVPPERRPHLYTLAIGDDANTRFMRALAAHGGVFEQVNSTEPLDFKLATFIHEIGLAPLEPVSMSVGSEAGANDVYRLGDDNFPGSRASWVGEYTKPGKATFTVTAGSRTEQVDANLPVNDTEHTYLPAAWARARVDALMDKMDREGEDKASIDEIIRLSRKYHFVTPYTSFLAAPRSLLRPRLIRPSDPILRVRTDPSILSVIAIFPFGLTKPLRYLKQEDMWQTRFLAPDDMADGSYAVRLILRDRAGHAYQERKTFLISSHAPVVRVVLSSARVHAGGSVLLHVQASATTRTITARMYGAAPLALRWNESDKANSGSLSIPPHLPPGRYAIHVTAEDIAHNVSHQEASVEVVP